MTTLLAGGLIASLGVIGAQLAILFWQMKRASSASDRSLQKEKECSKLKSQIDALSTAVADRDRALKDLESDRARCEKSLVIAQRQRDELLKEAFKTNNPSVVASAVRDALEQLGELSKEVPPGSSS